MKNQSNALPEVYQTGRTSPPKSHMGLVMFLLVLVIFLGGIVSVLGLMNIHLFRMLQLQKEDTSAMEFETVQPGQELAGISAKEEESCLLEDLSLGITGEDVTYFYRRFYEIPQGIIITQVDTDSDAFLMGLRPGDIITALEGEPVTGSESFCAMLRQCLPGQTVRIGVCRDEEQMEFQLVMDSE